MQFEWNKTKAAANARKHRVAFEETTTVFSDPLAIIFADPDHSFDEERYITFGLSRLGRLLVVSNTPRGSDQDN